MNTDGSGVTSIGPPAFGRLNDIHIHQNGVGYQGRTIFHRCKNYNVQMQYALFNSIFIRNVSQFNLCCSVCESQVYIYSPPSH